MRRRLLFSLASLATIVALPQENLDKFSPQRLSSSSNPHIGKYANVLSASVWRDGSKVIDEINVCWESLTPELEGERAIVEQAVHETWERASALRFRGWDKCVLGNHGVRIMIDDSGPMTKGLGRQLDRVENGMILNLTYKLYQPRAPGGKNNWIYASAVHEFGHAIGLAHEQNKYDAPGECWPLRSGSNGDKCVGAECLTPYDPHSVMNYCNSVWNNNGKLSDLDKKAVMELYGVHKSS